MTVRTRPSDTAAVVLDPLWLAAFARADEATLAVYVPYGVIALGALDCYAALGWRNRYLASAIILGPLNWLRPAVAVTAVQAVEPLASRIWYAPARPSLPSDGQAGRPCTPRHDPARFLPKKNTKGIGAMTWSVTRWLANGETRARLDVSPA